MTNDLEFIRTIVSRKLNRAILESLKDGPLRYSQLLHAVSQASPTVVYPKTLTRTLEFLQAEGLVEHHQDEDPADYRLTAAGAELVDLVNGLGRWRREHRTDDD